MNLRKGLIVFLLALILAGCNFSLAEDITPPPGLTQPPEAELAPTATSAPATTKMASPATATALPVGTLAPVNIGTPSAGVVTISGKVTNGSGGSLPVGLTATLHGILNQQETLNLEIPLNQDGYYKFQNVPLTTGMEFLVVVQYGPVSFLSAGGTYDGTTGSYDQPVTIYNSTSDLTGLSLDQVHLQASITTAGEIQMDEIYVMTNPGNAAVEVATDGTTLPFASLPKGALQPAISLSQSSAALVMSDNGFAMLPGSQQYAFVVSFTLPYENNKVSLTQPFVLAPKSLTVIVPAGVKVTGKGLADQGASDFQGSTYQIYNGGPLAKGASIDLTLAGRSQSGAAAGSTLGTTTILQIGLGIVGLLLVAAGVIFLVRDRRKVIETVPAEMAEAEPLDDETTRMADAILELDDQFAAGKISQANYQQRRDQLKEELKGRL